MRTHHYFVLAIVFGALGVALQLLIFITRANAQQAEASEPQVQGSAPAPNPALLPAAVAKAASAQAPATSPASTSPVSENEPAELGAEPRHRGAPAEEMPPELRRLLTREPTPEAVLAHAEKFLALRPRTLRNLRLRSRSRAVFPVFALGGKVTDTGFNSNSDQLPQNFHTDQTNHTFDRSANVGLLWDLRDFAFNAAELDVYSIIELRRRVLTEVGRVYLARRLLQIDLYTSNPDLRLQLSLRARIAEYTSILDSVTDGWFSEQVAAAQAAAAQ
ncbi:MAG: hypothetical protein QM778_28325 [Myxococcales bacterium]